MDETKTHRCSGCLQHVEHYQVELCPSCGLCLTHCTAAVALSAPDRAVSPTDHQPMSARS